MSKLINVFCEVLFTGLVLTGLVCLFTPVVTAFITAIN